jgi:DNA-binding XRE family transcriptional regulator
MPERASAGGHCQGPCRPSSAPSVAGGGTPREPGNGDGAPQEARLWGYPRPGRGRGVGSDGAGPPLSGYRPAELFGRAIRYLRQGRKLLLVDLAARAGISTGRLSEIENGKYRAWQNAADEIARALDFPDAQALLRAFYGADYPPEGAPDPPP